MILQGEMADFSIMNCSKAKPRAARRARIRHSMRYEVIRFGVTIDTILKLPPLAKGGRGGIWSTAQIVPSETTNRISQQGGVTGEKGIVSRRYLIYRRV